MKKTKKRQLKKSILYLFFVVSFVSFVVFLYLNNLIALEDNILYFNYDILKYLIFSFLIITIYKIIKNLVNE